MQQAIAILDSGVGGLTVVKEVMRQLPQEKIIYFGDTARTPYGPRPAEVVTLFTKQIVDYLVKFDPKMVVIACNTATAIALDEIRSSLKIPVLGVIHPGARAAIKHTRSGQVGVIGTEGTIKSGAYEQALRLISPQIEVVSQACPLLVPLVEQGMFDVDQCLDTVRLSLNPILSKPMDTLILGCTHYPFLAQTISRVIGPKVSIISSADETASEVSTILHHKGQLNTSGLIPIHQFFCSGNPHIFRSIAETWLGEQVRVTPVVWQIPNII